MYISSNKKMYINDKKLYFYIYFNYISRINNNNNKLKRSITLNCETRIIVSRIFNIKLTIKF